MEGAGERETKKGETWWSWRKARRKKRGEMEEKREGEKEGTKGERRREEERRGESWVGSAAATGNQP